MMDSTNMSTPVTRGELLEALAQSRKEFRKELRQELQEVIAPLATRAELELWGGALLARIQQGEHRITNLEHGQQELREILQQTREELLQQLLQTRQEFQQQLLQTEQRLYVELARHTSAIGESMRVQISASVEPYVDLPQRMTRLETEVFGSKPGPRRTRRRSH